MIQLLHPISTSVCICVHVCGAHVCMGVHAYQKSAPSGTILLILRQRLSLVWDSAVRLDWLVEQQAPGICLCLHSQPWEFKHILQHAAWVWEGGVQREFWVLVFAICPVPVLTS